MPRESITTHELKIHPTFFKDVVSGHKTFELRKNDRDYKLGDALLLREWDNEKYTGHHALMYVCYILRDHPLLTENTVCLGIKP